MESKKVGGGGGDSGGESEVEKGNSQEAVRALQVPEKRLRNQKRNQSKDPSGAKSSLELAGLSGPLAFSSRMIEEKRSKGKQEEKLPNEQSPSLENYSEKAGVSDNDATVSPVKTEVEGSSVILRRKKGKAFAPAPKMKGPQKKVGNENRMAKILVKGANSALSLTTHSEGKDEVTPKKKSELESNGKGEGTSLGKETETEGDSDSEWEDTEEGESATNEGQHSEPPPRLQKSARGRKVHRARFVGGRRFPQPRRPNTFMRQPRYPPQSGAVNFLQHFLSFLYYAGMSPMKPKSAKKLPKWLICLQVVLYCLLTAISTVEVLDEVKYGWINFRVNGGMFNFVTFGFFLSNCTARVYNVYLLFKSESATSKIMAKIEKIGGKQSTEERNTAKLVVFAIATIAVMLAGASTIFGNIPIYDWTLTDAIKDRSYDFSESLFIWSSNNYYNATKQLVEDYGKKVTLTTTAFALIGNIICFLGTLHDCLILDLMPILTLQIYFLQKPLSSSWRRKVTRQERTCHSPIYWQNYMDLRDICKDINEVFGDQLKIVHLQNVLFFGYFLLRILNKNPLSVEFLVDLFCIVKVSITYYYAAQVGNENESYEDYVTELSNRTSIIRIDDKKMSIQVLVNEMKKHLIGIGKGKFFMNEEFLITFLGVVISMIIFLSGQYKEECYTQS